MLLALELADDMAMATTFGLINDEILAISHEAVMIYPNALLLNNYATMLNSVGHQDNALFFYTLALQQEPNNPILLTNIANVYLERENYEAARDFATQALQAMDDFGPAYQVLTTVHLHDGHYELAAETMVKSAKYNFNDGTMHHFDSFLEAVQQLDPTQDDYPLHKKFIDELYATASTQIDTLDINTTVDTPASQITLPKFPTIVSEKHLQMM